jgi:hypothetical protein
MLETMVAGTRIAGMDAEATSLGIYASEHGLLMATVMDLDAIDNLTPQVFVYHIADKTADICS